MDLSPILISMKTAMTAIVITFFAGIAVAYWVVNMKHERIKMVCDGILTLPLVLPPTVAAFSCCIFSGLSVRSVNCSWIFSE